MYVCIMICNLNSIVIEYEQIKEMSARDCSQVWRSSASQTGIVKRLKSGREIYIAPSVVRTVYTQRYCFDINMTALNIRQLSLSN